MSHRRKTTMGGPHPVHAIMLAFPIALFSSALATDIAYLRTAEVQWTNFSAWLISGALLFGGLVLAWALISLLLGWRRANRNRNLLYVFVVAAMWTLGLVNILKHSQDGWYSVETFGLLLSILCTFLALIAGLIAFTRTERELAT